MEAAEQLSYRPNAIARSLIMQRSNIVGLVVAEITNPFYSAVLETISEKLQQNGQHVLLFSVAQAHDIDQALPALLQYQVDGVIITSAVFSSEVAYRCAEVGRPVVLFNRYVPGAGVSAVCTDNIGGGRMIADLMIDAGYRRLAFVAGTADTSTSTDRQQGFFSRVSERGMQPPGIERGDFDYESGMDAARHLFARSEQPDGVFCANDMMAMGLMDVARTEFGLRIPEDLGVVGFDDIPQAAWATYNLTTFRQEVEAMTDETLSILRARIENGNLEPKLSLVPGQLISRGSVRVV